MLRVGGSHGQRTLQAPLTMQWAVRQREPPSRPTTSGAGSSTGKLNCIDVEFSNKARTCVDCEGIKLVGEGGQTEITHELASG